MPKFIWNRDFICIWLSNCCLFTTFYALIDTLPMFVTDVIGLICLSLASTPFVFLTAAAIIGVGFGSLSPSLQSITMKSAPNRRGLAIGTYLTFFDMGVGLGSLFLGIIASRTNFSTMYIISAVIVAISALVYYSLYHRKKETIQNRNQLQTDS